MKLNNYTYGNINTFNYCGTLYTVHDLSMKLLLFGGCGMVQIFQVCPLSKLNSTHSVSNLVQMQSNLKKFYIIFFQFKSNRDVPIVFQYVFCNVFVFFNFVFYFKHIVHVVCTYSLKRILKILYKPFNVSAENG